MAANVATGALKKLSRYCCDGCGATELYLYCWKGCRHVQSIKTFYTETKSIQQELEMLRVTIYEQEIRFREFELQLQEKQESLDFLVQQVKKLPELYPAQATENLVSSNLPSWRLVGVEMMWQRFDGDRDGFLSREELNQLKNHLRKTHDDIDEVLPTPRDDEDPTLEPLTARSLLKLYTTGGATKLADDLRSLGVLYGSTEMLAQSIALCDARLTQISKESQRMKGECDDLKKEVDESTRAKTRLREVFAASKTSLDDQARDLLKLREKEEQAELQLRLADETAAADAASLSKAKRELAAARHAVLDLRALVDDQVSEKEKWQRYCWELEERLHEAIHTSHAKERDLWRTRDAKKEEARKNMLLYIDAQKGKRHFERPAESVEDGASDSTLPAPAVNKPERPEMVEMGTSKCSDGTQLSSAALGANALHHSQQERT